MSLFTDKIELGMQDSRTHLVEKYVFDVKKGTVQIHVKSGYEALVNGFDTIGSNETNTYYKKTIGNSITAFVYQKGTIAKPIIVPFFAGQHTISLDTHKTAKATFALVGNAKVEIDSFKELARYFDNTISYADLEKEINDKFKEQFSIAMTAAAKSFINSASTDVSIHSELKNIAKAGISGSAVQNTLLDMGCIVMPAGITLRLNPIGDSEEVIAKINAKFNEAALEEFDDAKKEKQRQWDKEDKQMDYQHEIDVINAENTDTHNRNDSHSYNYQGNVPKYPHGEPREKQPKKRFCSNCGRELAPTDTFCPSCGTKTK
ncbi:MAG: zinc-ribbon domain-containing protein [Bacilli bacterium]|nr:zinc-ribbon domain-containing protein [Bacilli bacterium]